MCIDHARGDGGAPQTPSHVVDLPADEPAQISAYCERLGIPGIVDVHSHFMPENVMRKVWGYFDAASAKLNRSWPIAYRFEPEARLETIRNLGVVRFTSMIYPHKPGMAAWLNEWGRDFAAQTPDCAQTATFYPELEAADYVADALDAGAEIFKAHVQVGAYDPCDPLLTPVWGQIEDAQIPVILHAGSGPEPGPHTGPGPIAEVLARFPRLRLVFAHMGSPEAEEFLELAERYESTGLDVCMSFTDFTEAQGAYPRHLLPRVRELGLAGRIHFGSDFPNIPYPYVHQVDALARLDLGDEWLRKVLYDNGAALIGT